MPDNGGTKRTEIAIHNDHPDQSLIPALQRHLPSSIPLLRRIQHAVAHSDTRSTTYLVATANLPPQKGTDVDTPWLAAYVNLFSGHETQIWIYSSLEAEAGSPDDQHDTEAGPIANFSRNPSANNELARAQLMSLFAFIKQKVLPEYLASVAATSNDVHHAEAVVATDAVPKIPKHPPQSILIGSLHTGVMSLLSTTTTTDPYVTMTPIPGLKVHRYDLPPYVKYLFHPSIYQRENNDEHPLPPGYRYVDRKGRRGLLPHQADLVSSRTSIPRSRETLLSMSSVVIYSDDDPQDTDEMPIAWGFLGVDGSLATLYVESAHRGQGLAVILSKEVMRMAMAASTTHGKRIFGSAADDGEMSAYTHADVATTNAASRRVMEKVGGKRAWTVTWTVIEELDNIGGSST